jgi:hypothetical protein
MKIIGNNHAAMSAVVKQFKNNQDMHATVEASVQTCPKDVSNRDVDDCLEDFIAENKFALEHEALKGFESKGAGLLFVSIEDLAAPSYSWATYQPIYLGRTEIPKLAKLSQQVSDDCTRTAKKYDPEMEFIVCLCYRAKMRCRVSQEKWCFAALDNQHKKYPNARLVSIRQDFLHLMSWSQPFESWSEAQIKDCHNNLTGGADTVLQRYKYLEELDIEIILEFCRPTLTSNTSPSWILSYLKKGKVEVDRFLDATAVGKA